MMVDRISSTPSRRFARAVLGAFKRVRHWALRAKLATRARRAWQRLWQLASYQVPGELKACPACGGSSVRHLEPLALSHPPAPSWYFGFISGCSRCGVLFANPLPTNLEDVYSPEGDWGRHRQEEQEKQVSRERVSRVFADALPTLDVLDPPVGARVLDFGCGLGGLLDTLADAGWETYGLDPSTKVAFQRHREVASVPDTPTFDLVVLHHVLEHVAGPLVILRQLAKATRPGGILMVSVPNLEGLDRHGDLRYCIRSKTHVLAYSGTCLEWLCAAAGFAVIGAARHEGSGFRQCVVLARREAEARSLPTEPLRVGEASLRHHYKAHPEDGEPFRSLPVRFRAALSNWRRLHRRRPPTAA